MAKCIFFLHEIGTRQETSRYLIVSTYTTTTSTRYPFLPFKHFIHCSVEHTCQEDLYLRIQQHLLLHFSEVDYKWNKM